MKLGSVSSEGSRCLLCDWKLPNSGEAGERGLRAHLRDAHGRWMVNCCTSWKKNSEVRELDGPRWEDRSLGKSR